MAMQEWEMRQRQKGNVAGAEMARALRAKFGDVPLPVREQSPLEIKRFVPEAREALERQGFVIYGLTGQSISTLREGGRHFWSTWHQGYDFEALGSMQSEVAINPSGLFLPRSNRKNLSQQQEMVDKYSERLGNTVKGVKAVIGEAPDYVELAFAHLDATTEKGEPDYLFGEKYGYDYARTKTKTSGFRVARVGDFRPVDGLCVRHLYSDDGDGDVHVAPLVVPV